MLPTSTTRTTTPQTTATREQLQRARDARARRRKAEAEKARRIDVFAVFGYEPTARQRVFHAAREFDVLYGGAAGGGKSRALLMEGVKACIRYPGIRVVAFRRSYPELEESLLYELALIGHAALLGARYNEGKHDLRFPNGSVFSFRYAENMKDATRRQGGQIQLLIVDEVTLMDPNVVAFLLSRVRSGDARIPVLGFRGGSNPGGIGHGKVRAKYVVATDHGDHTVIDERGRTVRFVPAKLSDNPHLNPEYAADLEALPEQMRAAFKDGSWDSFQGQAFPEWRRDLVTVPAFELPASWLRYGGMDWGWSAPAAYVELAKDQDGRVWVYREVTRTQTPEPDMAAAILAVSTARTRWGDPAMWGQVSSALPIATNLAVHGLALLKADNDRLSGKMRVHTYLRMAPACQYHREQGLSRCPLLHILDKTAPELARTMPDLPVDPDHPEDVDTDAEDHHYDALRYALMGVGTAPRIVTGTGAAPERAPITDPAQRVEVDPNGFGVAPGGHGLDQQRRGPTGPRTYRPGG